MGYVTDGLIEATRVEQRALAQGLDQRASLHVVLTNDDLANVSYQEQSVAWGELVRGKVQRHAFGDDYEAATYIRDVLAPDDNVDGILAYLPSWTYDGEAAIREVIPPAKDVDGATLMVAQPRLPATTEASWKIAELLTGCNLKEVGAIGVLGYGKRTLKPLVDTVMRDMHIEPAFILKSGKELIAFQEEGIGVPELMECDLVFSAVPIGIMLTPDRVRAGQKIVDVGTGGINPLTNKPCGNVDPRVFDNKEVDVTAFRRSVGRVTTAIGFGRAIDERIRRERKNKTDILAEAALAGV